MKSIRNRKLLTLKINKKGIFPFIFLIVLIILMGGNSQNPDIRNYIRGYIISGFAIEESYVYTLVKNLSIHAGLSFEIFRLVLYIFGLLNIRFACKKIGANTALTYICYGLSLMMIDATQTYNFFGMSLILIGVVYLITGESHNRTKYVIAVLLASGFHMAFLFYLPFIFIYRRKDNKQLFKIYIVTTAAVFLLSTILSMSGLAGIIYRVLEITGLSTYQSYLRARTRYGHFYPMLIHLISCLYSYFYYKEAKKNNYNCKEVCRIILLLNLYGIFAFPLFRFQLTIARLTRNLEMMTFISGAVFIKEKTNHKARILLILSLLVLAGVMGYFSVYSSYEETIVHPFWNNNWILGRQ